MKNRLRKLSIVLIIVGLIALFFLPGRVAVGVFTVLFCGTFIVLNHFSGWSFSHPFSFMFISSILVYIGPAVDLFWLDDLERSRILLGNGYEMLATGMFTVTAGMAFLIIGYSLQAGERLGKSIPEFPSKWDTTRANRVILFYGFISVAAFILVILSIDLSTLSAKRTLPTNYLRWLVEFSLFAGLISFVTIVAKDKSFRSTHGIVWASLVSLILVYCILISNRSTILGAIILFVAVYVQFRPLKAELLLGLGSVMIIFAGIIYSIRTGVESVSGILLSPIGLLDSVFGAKRGYLPAVANIVEQTPEPLGFRYGETLIQWVVFPIPRAVWQGKPESVGSQVATQVYNHPSGMPPTVVGDLYWNGAIFGVAIGMFVLGLLIRGFTSYRAKTNSVASSVLATVILIYLSSFNDVSKLIIDLLLITVPLILAFIYISHGERRIKEMILLLSGTSSEGAAGDRTRLKSLWTNSLFINSFMKFQSMIVEATKNCSTLTFLRRFDQGPNE